MSHAVSRLGMIVGVRGLMASVGVVGELMESCAWCSLGHTYKHASDGFVRTWTSTRLVRVAASDASWVPAARLQLLEACVLLPSCVATAEVDVDWILHVAHADRRMTTFRRSKHRSSPKKDSEI